jgi:hypothetical protein
MWVIAADACASAFLAAGEQLDEGPRAFSAGSGVFRRRGRVRSRGQLLEDPRRAMSSAPSEGPTSEPATKEI